MTAGTRCPPGQGLNATLCIPVQTSSGPSTPTTSSPQQSYASTQHGQNANATYSNCLARYGLDVNNQRSNPQAITICSKEAYPWLSSAPPLTPSNNPVELNQIRNATLSKCEQTNSMKHCFQQELQLYGNTLEPGVRSLVQCETQHSMDYCFSNAGSGDRK